MQRASRRALCTVILACAVQSAQAQTRLEERYGTDFAAPPEPPPNPFALPTPGARTHLTYQYAYGVEAEHTYRRDRDLNRGVRDNEALLKPQLNGIVVWRPVNWLEATLELALEREFAVQEELSVTLPIGTVTTPPKRHATLPVVQAFLNVRRAGDRSASSAEGATTRTSATGCTTPRWTCSARPTAMARSAPKRRSDGRSGRTWTFAPHSRQVKDRIDTYMLYADTAASRAAPGRVHDHPRRPLARGRRAVNTGLRVIGLPLYPLTYWGELAG